MTQLASPPVTNLMPPPASVVSNISQLQNDLQTALDNANNIVTNISPSDIATIQSDVTVLEGTVSGILTGYDATQASPAIDAQISAESIGVLVGMPNYMVTRLTLVNPNLFLLAAQYLGDATLWENIAEASNLPYDPQPIGTFQVIIPNT
jgi:hypothetical protein